jgi:translocation and assembly module TamA
LTERVGSRLDIQVCTVRPGLLVTLLLLLGLPLGALAQPADAADEGVQLVGAAGPSGRVATALEEALRRFRLPPEADEADEERELRRAERAATEVLATEGYFSPALRFEPNTAQVPRYRLFVETGRQTTVGSVEIRFRGPLAEPAFAERAASLKREWSLPAGAPFRSAEWEAAKNRLMLAVTARDFAAATLAESSAEVDAERATAVLTVEVDSGPAYRVGPPRIEGLQRHDAALVERFNPFKPGAPFDRALMLQFQQALQETAFFNSVVVTLDLESAIADEAPLRVQLREALLRRLSVGVGFATNTGAHIEALYRQAITFGRPYLLQSGFRVDKTGEFAYVDMIFPPQRGGARDSIGALLENSDIENLQINRWHSTSSTSGAKHRSIRRSRSTCCRAPIPGPGATSTTSRARAAAT